jgi:Transposase DNA-binding/Transposase Tn5 dimerisation domain/Transposase DDE domain
MNVKELENAENWAVETFGTADLGDPRRTDRLVKVATALGENPSVSLPRSMRNWAETQGAYRFLGNEAVSHEQIMMPHWIQTRSEAEQRSQVLLIGDTTDVNLSSHKTTKGLGPVGGGKKARGFFVHSVLAVDAKDKQLLGCMDQQPFIREPAPEKETKAQRNARWRESLIWEQSIERIGPVPANTQWISVGDRGSDIFRFWQRCQDLGYDFVTRVAQNRNVLVEEEEEQEDQTAQHLKTLARSLPSQGVRVLTVPAERGRPEREALVNISWSQVTVQPPVDAMASHQVGMKLSLVRVWESEPPEGVEALEWILVTSMTVDTAEEAWQCVTWYKWRWLIEDFHKVLKTGCLLEDRCLQTVEAMCNLLAILTPTAMRLLWLRQVAQTAPDTPATDVISKDVIQVVLHLDKRPTATLTAHDLWHTIARFGGYLDRKSDPPPGWQTLWHGWIRVQTVLEGVHLARHFTPS